MPNTYKTKLTRFGYIVDKKSLTNDEIDEVKTDLTVRPFRPGNYGRNRDDSFSIYQENGKYLGIPKYYGIERFGKPLVDTIEDYAYPKYDMKYTGTLRPHQEMIVNKVIKGFNECRGGLLVAGCGSGKTNMAIYIACHYKIPVLWLTHKEFLARQVEDRVKSTTNITSIGMIQQKKVQVDHPFVIGMIQSVAKINYDNSIFKNFGMIIVDEVHHMAARHYSKIFQKMTAKYMLGISAEKSRTDGLYGIINWYMGPIIHEEEQEANDKVIVYKFRYKTGHKARIKEIYLKHIGEPDRSTMITNLTRIKRRNLFILALLEILLDMGRNILCLTSRLYQIDVLKTKLESNPATKGNVGLYIGGMKQEELKKSSTKQIILGTFEMAQEGLDLEDLNVILMCTPKSAVKQGVGRILRKKIFEKNPMVIDISDIENSIFAKQSSIRDQYFHKQQYCIQKFNIVDYHDIVDGQQTLPDGFHAYDDMTYLRRALTKPVKQNKKPIKTVYRAITGDDVEFLD